MPRPHERQDALGSALREARKARGYSQEQLEALVKMDQARISQLEGGQVNPTWLTVKRICDALGIKISDLALRVEAIEKRQRAD